jgi:hypothetical protein
VKELPEAARALIDGPNYAHVATRMPDGGPHKVPARIGRKATGSPSSPGRAPVRPKTLGRDPLPRRECL